MQIRTNLRKIFNASVLIVCFLCLNLNLNLLFVIKWTLRQVKLHTSVGLILYSCYTSQAFSCQIKSVVDLPIKLCSIDGYKFVSFTCFVLKNTNKKASIKIKKYNNSWWSPGSLAQTSAELPFRSSHISQLSKTKPLVLSPLCCGASHRLQFQSVLMLQNIVSALADRFWKKFQFPSSESPV